MAQAPREAEAWTQAQWQAGVLLWLSVKCRSCCLLEGRGQVGTAGTSRLGGTWELGVCVSSCWTGPVSTPAHWDQGKTQLKSLIL